MAKRWLLFALVAAAAALAGCLGGLAEELDSDPVSVSQDTQETENQTVWYHRPDGAQLTDEERDAYIAEHGERSSVRKDTGFQAWEPTIGITEDGTMFAMSVATPNLTISPEGVNTEDAGVIRSTDWGETWEVVTPTLPWGEVVGAGGISLPPVTFDPFLTVDRDTGRVFVSHLEAITCAWLAFSDDKGASWTHNPIGCSQPPGGHDHQNVGVAKPRVVEPVGYENVVYYCTAQTTGVCAPSFDGGRTFGPAQSLPICANMGHLAGGPDGRAFIASACPGKNPRGAVTEDDGLRWELMDIAPDARVADHEVRLAVDGKGVLSALWIDWDTTRPMLAVSTDHGASWSKPVDVGVPSVKGAALPAIDAREDGTLALAYVGSHEEPERGLNSDNVELFGDSWQGFVALVRGAGSGDLLVESHQVSDPGGTLATGQCGVWRCVGIGDFIDVVFGPEGRPWAAMADQCVEGDCGGGGLGFVAGLEAGSASG